MSEALVRPMPGTVPRNGLPWPKPYAYRGCGVDTLTPELGDDELFAPVDTSCPCGGTTYGYRQHLKAGEKPCPASRDTVNIYERERHRQKALSRCSGCGYSVTSLNHKTLCWRAS